jgi:heterodisulfide reductase subunit C
MCESSKYPPMISVIRIPGLSPWEEILDVLACDEWKKKHYYAFHQGHNCGICSSVCPYGRKNLGT